MSEQKVSPLSKSPSENTAAWWEHNFPIVLGLFWLFFLLFLGAYYLGTKNYEADHAVIPVVSFPTLNPVYPTLMPTAVPAQAWSLYTNATNNFSLNYPAGWEVQNSGDKLINFYNGYRSGGIGGVWVTIFINSLADYPLSEPTFDTYYASGPGPMTTTPGRTAVKIGNVTVDGYKAVKYTEYYNENNTVAYYLIYDFIKGDSHYSVSFSTGSRELEKQYLPVYDTMISSFHFSE